MLKMIVIFATAAAKGSTKMMFARVNMMILMKLILTIAKMIYIYGGVE